MTPTSLLRAGRNCWRIERAERMAAIVDAARYFEVVADAIERARRSILILGWDVHSRVVLRRRTGDDDRHELRRLLDEAARRGVRVRVLVWDWALVFAFERELLPTLQLGWLTHPNLEVEMASDHLAGGCHHQKLVVVDDQLAFTGGIDLTIARWDENPHRAHHPQRVTPGGETYGPFHDLQLAVSGDAASALGELARARWEQATGRALGAPEAVERDDRRLWPDRLAPTVTDVDVGIARTVSDYQGREPHHEVERLYLDAIAVAEDVIYLENQYLTAPTIAEALADRLAEPDGPEVVIITPKNQSGRLEELTMGELRNRFVQHLLAADEHDRLTVRTPLAEAEEAVNVHAKVMIVDDRLLRVGSANLSRRSMRLDSECDLAVEAEGAHASEIREAIRGLRTSLLAEHLALGEDEVERQLAERGSLRATLEALDGERRRLPPLTVPDAGEESLGAAMADPAEPLDEAIAAHLLPREPFEDAQRRWPRVLMVVVAFLAMAAAWAWTPLKTWVRPETLSSTISPLVGHPAGAIVFGALAALASLVAVPITALIVAASLLFGPWLGSVAAILACVLGAAIGYAAGRLLLRDAVEKLMGDRFDRLRHALEHRGVLSVIAVRVIPVAPFAVVNVVAGSSHLSFSDYLLGTAVGMTPGILGMSFAADSIAAAVRAPTTTTVLLAFGVVALVAATLLGLRRWLTDAAATEESRP